MAQKLVLARGLTLPGGLGVGSTLAIWALIPKDNGNWEKQQNLNKFMARVTAAGAASTVIQTITGWNFDGFNLPGGAGAGLDIDTSSTGFRTGLNTPLWRFIGIRQTGATSSPTTRATVDIWLEAAFAIKAAPCVYIRTPDAGLEYQALPWQVGVDYANRSLPVTWNIPSPE